MWHFVPRLAIPRCRCGRGYWYRDWCGSPRCVRRTRQGRRDADGGHGERTKRHIGVPTQLCAPCAFVALDLAVYGVSVFSLDSPNEDGARDDGLEWDCDRERKGESALAKKLVADSGTNAYLSGYSRVLSLVSACRRARSFQERFKVRWIVAPVSRQRLVLLGITRGSQGQDRCMEQNVRKERVGNLIVGELTGQIFRVEERLREDGDNKAR